MKKLILFVLTYLVLVRASWNINRTWDNSLADYYWLHPNTLVTCANDSSIYCQRCRYYLYGLDKYTSKIKVMKALQIKYPKEMVEFMMSHREELDKDHK